MFFLLSIDDSGQGLSGIWTEVGSPMLLFEGL
jgi:hypothetical protein